MFEVIVGRSDVNMGKRTNESREVSPVEHIKSRKINIVVHIIEGRHVVHSDGILRRNILPS